MPKVTYVQPDGSRITCELRPGESVMDGALDNAIPGIRAQCGGACTCATCHCYVPSPWFERLAGPVGDEAEMLEYVPDRRPESRLSCQVVVSAELDGLEVGIPREQG